MIKWAYFSYDISNTTTGRLFSKYVIEMLSMLDILIEINFERDTGKKMQSHHNGIDSLRILVIDLNFGQWSCTLFALDFLTLVE